MLTIVPPMDEAGESGAAWIDARGIHPPDAYAIRALPGPSRAVVVGLAGELDMAAAPELRERLEAAVTGQPDGVVLDMTEVTFADSSILRELLRAHGRLDAVGARLILAGIPTTFARVLELTRAQDLLVTAPTVEDALTALARS
jgi:anti-sigma B factor antagonist